MAQDVKVTIKNGRMLIDLPTQALAPSASGKTLVLASSHGNVTTACIVDGKPVTVGVNAYIKP